MVKNKYYFYTVFLLVIIHLCKSQARPHRWIQKERCEKNKVLKFTIYLKQNKAGIAKLSNYLEKISDPKNSHLYGKYLSAEQVLEYIKPSNATVSIINLYLSNFKLHGKQKFLGDAIQIEMPISEIEKMLPTSKFFYYYHSQFQNIRIARTLKYKIPNEIKHHVDFISKLSEFRKLEKNRFSPFTYIKKKVIGDITGKIVIPQTLNNLYNIPPLMTEQIDGTNTNNRNIDTNTSNVVETIQQSVAEFQHALGPEGFNPDDLKKWQKEAIIIIILLL